MIFHLRNLSYVFYGSIVFFTRFIVEHIYHLNRRIKYVYFHNLINDLKFTPKLNSNRRCFYNQNTSHHDLNASIITIANKHKNAQQLRTIIFYDRRNIWLCFSIYFLSSFSIGKVIIQWFAHPHADFAPVKLKSRNRARCVHCANEIGENEWKKLENATVRFPLENATKCRLGMDIIQFSVRLRVFVELWLLVKLKGGFVSICVCVD